MVAVEPGIAWQRRLAAGAWLAAGITSTALWSYYSFWQVVTANDHAQMVLWDWPVLRDFYRPADVLMMLGPAILGIPVLFYALWLNRMYFLLIGAAGNAVLYLVGYVINFPFGHRFLPFMTFFLHLALTWTAVRLHDVLAARRLGRLPAVVAATAAVLLIVGQALFPARDMAVYAAWRRGETLPIPGFRTAGWGYRPVAAEMKVLAAQIGDHAVVLSRDPNINHVLPAFAGKVVRLQRTNPCVTDAETRNAAVDAFFGAKTTAVQRLEILRTFGITHIVTAVADPESHVVASLGRQVVERRQLGPWELATIVQ